MILVKIGNQSVPVLKMDGPDVICEVEKIGRGKKITGAHGGPITLTLQNPDEYIPEIIPVLYIYKPAMTHKLLGVKVKERYSNKVVLVFRDIQTE